MRPVSYRSDEVRSLPLCNQIATLDEMKEALGTPVDVTVFRKLKPLDYLTSYSHRGRYYTLREIARFDDHGLWSQADVWFSRFGTLLATAETFVNRSPRGYFADELARALHLEVQDALYQLTQQHRVTREIVSGLYLYTATAGAIQRGQLPTRRTVEAVPTVADASVLEVSEEELKASILLFYSLLDERQRRFVCRTGVAETGPWRRSSTGRLPRPRSSHRGPWTTSVVSSGCGSGPRARSSLTSSQPLAVHNPGSEIFCSRPDSIPQGQPLL
jgi:hypothetical protein